MSVTSIAREILNYLAMHQEAQDNLEGITHWWLLKQSVHRRVAEVRHAVRELVEMGYLIERRGADADVHYEINLDRLADIQALVEGGG